MGYENCLVIFLLTCKITETFKSFYVTEHFRMICNPRSNNFFDFVGLCFDQL